MPELWDDLAAEGNPPRNPLPHLLWIWRAWQRLSAERRESVSGVLMPMGGGVIQSAPGRIPWTAVRAWADYHDLSAAEFVLLDRCLGALDRTYAAFWASKTGKK